MNTDENIHALLSFKDIMIKVPPIIHPQLDYHVDFYIGTISQVDSLGLYEYVSTGLYNSYILPFENF